MASSSVRQYPVQTVTASMVQSREEVTDATWNLNATTNTFTTVADFLRYLRVVSDANVAGSPVVLMDIILKE